MIKTFPAFKLAFDNSLDITTPMPSDTEYEDTDIDVESYINSDAIYFSSGVASIFPCIIRYMDLTTLKLKYQVKKPQLTLLCNEWGNMVDIFNGRKRGVLGSAVFTGQPGIGMMPSPWS